MIHFGNPRPAARPQRNGQRNLGHEREAQKLVVKIAAIICTVNRPAILRDTVLSIARQTLAPQQIILASPASEHILPETLEVSGVILTIAPIGASMQRNHALRLVTSDIDLVAFLDDDIELSRHYLAEMARLFATRPDVIVASGRMLHDGGRSSRIDRQESLRLCAQHDLLHDKGAPLSFATIDSGYGCNMLVRFAELGECRFDEALPLYSWLEDRDFSFRCTQGKCQPVQLANAAAVHLGWRSGRVSGIRLGFSTVVNPMYLKRKAGTFSFWHIAIHYWLRCLVGNVLGILTRDKDYDRWGLLKGNFLGYLHLLSGNCDPGQILRM